MPPKGPVVPSKVPLPQLRRVRWAVRACLVLGVAASVAANVLHAERNPIAEAIAAWPPLALLLTVELISRVPVHRRLLAAVRLLATGTIAGIAAWVSYWHMAGVAARYGETGAAPYLLPLSVDGLVVVASVSLVELAGRIRGELAEPDRPVQDGAELVLLPSVDASTPPAAPARAVAMNGTRSPVGTGRLTLSGTVPTGPTRTTTTATVPARPSPNPATRPPTTAPGPNPATAAGTAAAARDAKAPPAGPRRGTTSTIRDGATGASQRGTTSTTPHGATGASQRGTTNTTPHSATGGSQRGTTNTTPDNATGGSRGRSAIRPAGARGSAVGAGIRPVPEQRATRTNRPVAETRRLAAELAASQPDATHDDLARQLGITTKRLKTVLAEALA